VIPPGTFQLKAPSLWLHFCTGLLPASSFVPGPRAFAAVSRPVASAAPPPPVSSAQLDGLSETFYPPCPEKAQKERKVASREHQALEKSPKLDSSSACQVRDTARCQVSACQVKLDTARCQVRHTARRLPCHRDGRLLETISMVPP